MFRAVLFTAMLVFTAANAAGPLVAPVTVTLRYPGATTAVIPAASGRPAFQLTLHAEPDADNVLSFFTLELLPLNAPKDADNLLDPPGNWHGYQPYFFRSDDFAGGPAKSFFGATRAFCRDRTALETTIAVKQVVLAPSRVPGTPEFRTLVLDVGLKSGPVVNGKPTCP